LKRTSPLATQIKKTLSPIISGRLLKVNHWEEARIDFNSLSFDDQQDILESIQAAMDEEVKKQFERARKLKSQMQYTGSIESELRTNI
jgi:hypothetical protein